MRRIRSVSDQVEWKRAGLRRPAPTDKRSLQLALRELDLPPANDKDKVILP